MSSQRTTKRKAPPAVPGNVVSLTDYKRTAGAHAGPNARRSTYHYPKSLLVQSYFDRDGLGQWHEPDFTLSRLGNENFKSPLCALLDQLESEGHDVQGARVEFLAFRDLAKQYTDMFFDLMTRPLQSTVAAHLFVTPKRRKP